MVSNNKKNSKPTHTIAWTNEQEQRDLVIRTITKVAGNTSTHEISAINDNS